MPLWSRKGGPSAQKASAARFRKSPLIPNTRHLTFSLRGEKRSESPFHYFSMPEAWPCIWSDLWPGAWPCYFPQGPAQGSRQLVLTVIQTQWWSGRICCQPLISNPLCPILLTAISPRWSCAEWGGGQLGDLDQQRMTPPFPCQGKMGRLWLPGSISVS